SFSYQALPDFESLIATKAKAPFIDTWVSLIDTDWWAGSTHEGNNEWSEVVHLGKKVATPFGCHIEETPQGIDQITRAMVLIGDGWCEAHFRAPKVTDYSVMSFEDVEYRFVPVLAVRNAMLCAHSLGKL